jgi:hypothetical protein
MESAFQPGLAPPLDLDGPPAAAGEIEHEVDLGARGRAVEAGGRSRWREREQGLDDEALPAGPGHRMPEELVQRLQGQQRVHETAVPNGFTAAGLPTSMQILCHAGDEAMALRIGWAYEQATDWTTRRPPEP